MSGSNMDALLKTVYSLQQNASKDFIIQDFTYDLVVDLEKFSSTPTDKQSKYQIEHPLYKFDDVCLIVRDGLKQPLKDLKCKVLSVKQLKSHYSRYQQRRRLPYKWYLVDDAVITMMPMLMGKYARNKCVKIRLDNGEAIEKIETKINTLLKTTLGCHSSGSCMSIKIAKNGQTLEEINDNCVKVLDQLRDYKSIHIKATHTPSFPLKIKAI